MLEIMPPGIWLLKISVSTPVMFAQELPIAWTNFGEVRFTLSSRVHVDAGCRKPVPSSISTRLSVGLCPGPSESELMAVSTMSQPGLDGLHQRNQVTPVVAWT